MKASTGVCSGKNQLLDSNSTRRGKAYARRQARSAEKDQPLTGEDLSRIYLDLLRRYHGDAQGVMKIEDQ